MTTQHPEATCPSHDDPHRSAQLIHPVADGPAPMICPACGGENGRNGVFCANPGCHKALGDFKYVLEALEEVSVLNHRQISSIDTRLLEILQRLERLENAALHGDQR